MQKIYMRFPQGKKKALTLSYDDGVVQDKRLLEILHTYGIKGTFNLNSGLFLDDFGRMSEEETANLYASYYQEVAAHGEKHLSLVGLSEMQIEKEIGEDKKALETLCQTKITGMAYAYGATNDNVISVLRKCGIAYARLANETGTFALPNEWLRWQPTCHHNNAQLFSLYEQFIQEENTQPQLFYLWGHSYEFDDNNNWDVIERFASYAGNRKDIWYATNGEICAYVKAFETLEWRENGTVYNPSDIDVYIQAFGKNYKISSKTAVALQE